MFHVPAYAILSYPDEPKKSPSNHNLDESKSRYTFVTANLLLGIESLGKFQNMPFVYSRLQKITDSFMNINRCVLLVWQKITYVIWKKTAKNKIHFYHWSTLYFWCPTWSHCYFTRLNLKKMGPLQFCLPVFLGIHRNHTQKELFDSWEGFLK